MNRRELLTRCWWKSWTLWINFVCLLLAHAESQLGLLQQVLPVNVYVLIAIVLPPLNIALRVITTAPLGKRDREIWR